ncbi:MAG TPA: AzlD domain-containing protein [Caproiciproducens sp.]|nr:AzlD domain-containing protein [Caproiciproducens sp.]
MLLTPIQTFLMIIATAFGAITTRFTPFFLFPEMKEPPEVITYLGKVLPPAMMGLLVVYCLRNVSVQSAAHGIPELISILAIVILHKWKNNTLLSIGGGTILYMFLVQAAFQ